MGSDICERTIKCWTDTDRVLPAIYQLTSDEIQEVIDGINDYEEELKRALREVKELAAL